MIRPILIVLVLPLFGCADFPALDATVSEAARSAPFPDLINIEELRATSAPASSELPSLDLRTANLQARADRLRGPVVDADTLVRMENGVR